MKYVRTYATSANLGPGFDTLGICFDLYNEYEYKISNHYKIISHDRYYNNYRHNLIIKSYEEVFKRLNHEIIYIYLREVVQHIPTSRGLGSSASCIVCGILMANDILGNPLSRDEMFTLASEIEGHPDNVAPLIYGGFTASFKDEDGVFHKMSLKISNRIHFMACIPSYKLTTRVSRSVLPKAVSLSDAVYNISHSIATIKALEEGNIELLRVAMKDKLHEPYRFGLIEGSDEIRDYAKEHNDICVISGAGPTLLLISDKKIEPYHGLKYWKYLKAHVKFEGACVYEK